MIKEQKIFYTEQQNRKAICKADEEKKRESENTEYKEDVITETKHLKRIIRG